MSWGVALRLTEISAQDARAKGWQLRDCNPIPHAGMHGACLWQAPEASRDLLISVFRLPVLTFTERA